MMVRQNRTHNTNNTEDCTGAYAAGTSRLPRVDSALSQAQLVSRSATAPTSVERRRMYRQRGWEYLRRLGAGAATDEQTTSINL